MRVLVCPDKLAGTLSAEEAADAIAAGWTSAAPDDHVAKLPLADGGPGFLHLVASAAGGRRISTRTVDPLRRPVDGWILMCGDTAYVESAQACGLHLLSAAQRDPFRTTSFGLGVLVSAAIHAGANEIIVGLGGSATNDGGAGMLAALGAVALDADGDPLQPGGGALRACAGLSDLPNVGGVRLVAAIDVDNPLLGPQGATAVFGPQKGVRVDDVPVLEAGLSTFSGVLERQLPRCPSNLHRLPGGGAGGGLGAAILACGGTCRSGFDVVAHVTRLDEALDGCDLVITGEGRLDSQTLRGKVVAGVAAAAKRRGVACSVIAGQVHDVPRDALDMAEVRSIAELFGSVAEAMARPAEGLRTIAADLANRWHS